MATYCLRFHGWPETRRPIRKAKAQKPGNLCQEVESSNPITGQNFRVPKVSTHQSIHRSYFTADLLIYSPKQIIADNLDRYSRAELCTHIVLIGPASALATADGNLLFNFHIIPP